MILLSMALGYKHVFKSPAERTMLELVIKSMYVGAHQEPVCKSLLSRACV